MNIRLAYPADFERFKSFFPAIKMYDEEDNEPIDLLVFSGGADVSLEYYLDDEQVEENAHLCYTNRARDEIEEKILMGALNGKKTVNKILGVCRGAQFLAVMLGGKLYPDLAKLGIQHEPVHELIHSRDNNLDFISVVNSLHHQGISSLGSGINRFGFKAYPKHIAGDKEMNVTEIATWMDDKILGIQFHPEYYMEQNPDKDKIRQFIYSWVAGNITIVK